MAEKIKLSQVRVNKHNPRTITDKKMQQLIVSLLVLPSMLDLRPVVVDNKMTALGGNMRLQALAKIANMSIDTIGNLLSGNKDFSKKTEGERKALLSYWEEWLKNPQVSIARADKMSETEKKQFVISDNASFGQWDFDALANEWENEDLNRWGVDVWQPEHPDFGITSVHPSSSVISPSVSPKIHEGEEEEDDFSNIPELSGRNLNPEELPKIVGDDDVVMERIIIVYPKERKDELCTLIGLSEIDKIVYNIDELNK